MVYANITSAALITVSLYMPLRLDKKVTAGDTTLGLV